jgi:hypothetical protein
MKMYYNITIAVYDETVRERYEYASDTESAVREAFVCLDEDGIYLRRIKEVKEDTVKIENGELPEVDGSIENEEVIQLEDQ